MVVAGEGTWSVGDDGNIRFDPMAGFSTTTTTAPSTGGTVDEVVSSGNPTGETVDVVLPTQIGGETIDPTTVQLVDPDTGDLVETVTVPGQGTWSVQTNGEAMFDPVPGFGANPTPMSFIVAVGGLSVTAEGSLVVTYSGGVDVPDGNSFRTTGHIAGSTALAVLPTEIQGMSILPSTILLIDPETGTPVRSATVASEGSWEVLSNGAIRFVPVAGFTGDPTPIVFQTQVAGTSTVVSGSLAVSFVQSTGGKLPFTGAGTTGLMMFALAFLAAGFAYRSGAASRLRRS